MFKPKWILICGDALAVAGITLVGFASHDELTFSYVPRMGAAFFSLIVAWLGIAPWFGLLEEDFASRPRPFLRITFAALYASTMAAFLRSLILQAGEIQVSFLFGLGAASVVGMNLWRWLYIWFIRSKS